MAPRWCVRLAVVVALLLVTMACEEVAEQAVPADVTREPVSNPIDVDVATPAAAAARGNDSGADDGVMATPPPPTSPQHHNQTRTCSP